MPKMSNRYGSQHATWIYGGRGISICHEWRENFAVFRDWAIASGYQGGLTIERNDNDDNYCPDNCTWIPRAAQARNKRTTVILTAWGESKTMAEWLVDPRCKVTDGSLRNRLKIGMDHETAISSPPYAHYRFSPKKVSDLA